MYIFNLRSSDNRAQVTQLKPKKLVKYNVSVILNSPVSYLKKSRDIFLRSICYLGVVRETTIFCLNSEISTFA